MSIAGSVGDLLFKKRSDYKKASALVVMLSEQLLLKEKIVPIDYMFLC
jgi:hypothetical protein